LSHVKRVKRVLLQEFNCNGAIKPSQDSGETLIKLSGDHRKAMADFLYEEGICEREDLRIHGA
jgi:translation initiation factor 1 (eIF-1/SUI1)